MYIIPGYGLCIVAEPLLTCTRIVRHEGRCGWWGRWWWWVVVGREALATHNTASLPATHTSKGPEYLLHERVRARVHPAAKQHNNQRHQPHQQQHSHTTSPTCARESTGEKSHNSAVRVAVSILHPTLQN